MIATKAADEMAARLPAPGAGLDITALVQSWESAPAVGVIRDDYAALNQGQLKNVARPYYDRLSSLGYTGQPLAPGQTYPWTGTGADAYALANLGQLKRVFSFTPASVAAPSSLIGIGWPALGTIIYAPSVDITGTWNSTPPLRTLTLNGQPVFLQGNTWFARAVPLANGDNILTLVATDFNGVVTTLTRTLTANYSPNILAPVTLTASPMTGPAPLTVTFTPQLHIPGTIQSVTYYYEGQAHPASPVSTLAPTNHTYQVAGTFYPVVTIKLADGSSYSSVSNATPLAQRTKVKVTGTADNTPLAAWSALRFALENQDLKEAANNFSHANQEKYVAFFNALGPALASQTVGELGELIEVATIPFVAQYIVDVATPNGIITFPICFEQEDGVWKIESF
jgi:Glucodextranase, domain B